MGNAPSSEQPNSDHYGLASESERSLADLVVSLPNGDHRSTPEVRAQLRDQIFGASHEELQSVASYHTAMGPSSPRPLSNSQDKAFAKDDKLDVDNVVMIIQELKKTATTEQLATLQKALLSATDIPQPPFLEANNRPRSDPSASSMLRRSSMFGPSPGTATRQNTPRVLKKKQSPSQKSSPLEQPRPEWSRDMIVASPLSTIAKLNSSLIQQKGGLPCRCATPLDLDHLGIHQLGSLRITNGAITPEPSILSRPLSPTASATGLNHEDYFTCNESTDDATTPGTLQTDDDKVDTPATDSSHHGEYPFPLDTSTPSTPKLQDKKKLLARPSRSPMGSRSMSPKPQPQEEQPMARVPSARAPTPFRLYMQEASSNPFLSPSGEPEEARDEDEKPEHVELPQVSPMATDSKPLPFDAESIYSDQAQYLSPASSVKKSRAESLRLLNGDSTSRRRHDLNRAPSSRTPSQPLKDDSVFEHEVTPDVRGVDVRSTAHADRAANLLRDSPKNASANALAPWVPPHAFEEPHQSPASTEDGPSRVFGLPVQDIVAVDNQPLQSLIDAEPELATPTRKANRSSALGLFGLQTKSKSSSCFGNEATSSLDLASSPAQSPPAVSPSTIRTEGNDTKPKPKKLVKKSLLASRHLRDSIMVPSQPLAESGVPSIPTDLASKYNARLSKNPDMEHLEHTFDSVSVVALRCDSPRPTSPPNLEIRFPSPTPTIEQLERGRKAKRSSLSASPHGIFRSLSRKSRERRKSVEYDHDEIVGVADFGTVAASLGASPYDAVYANSGLRSKSKDRKRRNQNRSSTTTQYVHPHQIGTRLLKTRSGVGMDEKAASELAFRRSRDRLANQPDYVVDGDQMIMQGGRPPMHSAWSDLPPVPRLPGAEKKPRPRSMPQAQCLFAEEQNESWPMGPNVVQMNTDGHVTEQPKSRMRGLSRGRPRAVSIEDVAVADDVDDTWVMQAKIWRARRQTVGESVERKAKLEHHKVDQDEPTDAPWPHEDDMMMIQAENEYQETSEPFESIMPRAAEAATTAPVSSGDTQAVHSQGWEPTEQGLQIAELQHLATLNPFSDEVNTASQPAASHSPGGIFDKKPALSPVIPDPDELQQSPGRISSPTRSIKERAAFFDRFSAGAQSPVRGPEGSPTRKWQPLEGERRSPSPPKRYGDAPVFARVVV